MSKACLVLACHLSWHSLKVNPPGSSWGQTKSWTNDINESTSVSHPYNSVFIMKPLQLLIMKPLQHCSSWNPYNTVCSLWSLYNTCLRLWDEMKSHLCCGLFLLCIQFMAVLFYHYTWKLLYCSLKFIAFLPIHCACVRSKHTHIYFDLSFQSWYFVDTCFIQVLKHHFILYIKSQNVTLISETMSDILLAGGFAEKVDSEPGLPSLPSNSIARYNLFLCWGWMWNVFPQALSSCLKFCVTFFLFPF